MKRTSLFYTLITLALAALANNAFAADPKVFSGNLCQPEIASLDVAQIDHFTSGTSANTDTPHVTCPVVRDVVSNVNGTSAFTIRVQSNGTNTLSCNLDSRNSTGGFLESASSSTTSSTPVNLNLDVDTSTSNGYYAVHCVLPQGGIIFNYRLEEF